MAAASSQDRNEVMSFLKDSRFRLKQAIEYLKRAEVEL